MTRIRGGHSRWLGWIGILGRVSNRPGDTTRPVDDPPGRPANGRRIHLLGHLWDAVVTMVAACWFLWIVAMAPGRLGTAVFMLLLALAASLGLRWAWWRFVTSRREHDYDVRPPLYWLHGRAD